LEQRWLGEFFRRIVYPVTHKECQAITCCLSKRRSDKEDDCPIVTSVAIGVGKIVII
jgi:hypothetical protein